ncbi:hypothetical protein [Novosphingobium panipatense]
MALHTDTGHPHVHITVAAEGYQGCGSIRARRTCTHFVRASPMNCGRAA